MSEPAPSKPSVLFDCVHNAGRSQMAAAFLTHLPQGQVEVRSAGPAPADSVNRAVAEAMTEAGIDIAAEVPKVLTTSAVQASDVVITMGCGLEVVALAETDRVDARGRHERLDLDRLRRRQRHLAEPLVRDRDDRVLRDLIALADLRVRDLAVLDRAVLAHAYPGRELPA